MTNSLYYNIDVDIAAHPDAVIYIIIGGRARGKTYSTLKSCMVNGRDFIFIKRTIEDVDLLCAGSGRVGQRNEFGIDLSPFRSINRDMGTDIRAHTIKKGLGGFWDHVDGEISGSPIGYILALNAVSKYKGFDLASSAPEQWIIFDEFIPNVYDKTNKEGEKLLDLYMTISRDREVRGLQPIKLICLANATKISNPIMNMLNITDLVADMQARGISETCLDSGIYIHMIEDNPEFTDVLRASPIMKAMSGTQWAEMSLDNRFAYDDFSQIGRTSLKGYAPVLKIIYKREPFYLWQKEGQWYFCRSRHAASLCYDLEKESQQKLFWSEWGMRIRLDTIDDNVLYECYTLYNLIMNYKQIFRI